MRKLSVFVLLLLPLFCIAADLTFDDCVREAAVSNKDLKSAAEKLAQAEFNKLVAEASLWPSVNASGSYGDNLSSGTSSSSYNLGASYSIFDGFNAKYTMAQAGEQVKYAKTVYDTTSASVRMRLKDAYIELVKSQDLVRISASIVDRRKQSAAMIKLRYEGGAEHKGSWLLAEANYTQALADQASAARELEIAWKQLCVLLGRDGFTPLTAVVDFKVSTDISAKPDMKALSAKNPQVLGAGYLANAADFALQQSYIGNYPVLSATAGYGGSSVAGSPLSSQFSLGLSASYTIFDGMRTRNNSDKAVSALKQARIDLDNTVIGTVISLEQAWAALLSAGDQAISQQKFYEANSERTKIADAQYDQGLLTFDNWTLIEDQMISSERNYLNARATALTAEASWINAVGGTIEDYVKGIK